VNAIQFDHVTKIYRGAGGYRSLRDDVSDRLRWRTRQTTPRAAVNALDDISLEVPIGQALALIGDNGAGKSTALKIISRITYPTSGHVSVRGRVGALIEVGTGLHQELTGRENVTLYGRILGFTGHDIRRRFDEIVEFAGIGSAIDQPVKQYSSGMELRLGFAIAAHLEPDILIVDEAISVGDAGFQHRCVERMSKLVREGRTLLFVTHNLAAVEALCDRTILLASGRIDLDGEPRQVVHEYLRRVHTDLVQRSASQVISGPGIDIEEVTLHDPEGRIVSSIRPGDPLTVRIRFRAQGELESPQFSIGISDPSVGMLTMASMLLDGEDVGRVNGEAWIEVAFDSVPFKPRAYDVVGDVRQNFGRIIDLQRLARFQVEDDGILNGTGSNVVTRSMRGAPVHVPYRWRYPGRESNVIELRDLTAASE
jgi:ABC-type polysaccharide/polyol phosphate transport system ATPase subunit